MEPVIKVRYKLRWLLVLLSIAAAAGQPGNPRKVDSLHICVLYLKTVLTYVQGSGSAKEWSLGCLKRTLAAR